MTSAVSPVPIATHFVRMARRERVVLVTLGAAALVVFLLELMLGTVRIPVADAIAALVGAAPDVTTETIIRAVRLPRALTAACVGAALGVRGLALQTTFRNRLAGPWLLGAKWRSASRSWAQSMCGCADRRRHRCTTNGLWLGVAHRRRIRGCVCERQAVTVGAVNATREFPEPCLS